MTGDQILMSLFDLAKVWGAVAIATFGGLQAWNTWNDRKQKENLERIRELKAGATELKEIRETIDELEKDIADLQEGRIKEKEQLQEKLDKLREYFGEMSREYLRVITSKH